MSIGTGPGLSVTPTAKQWKELFELSKKQTLAGITFTGIEKLPTTQRPPKEILLNWYNTCQLIKKQNTLLNRQAVAVSQKFREEGFQSVILKGQGIAALYAQPERRTPGDIDIWLEGGRDKILKYVRRFFPASLPQYHHIDFPIIKGLAMEIHFTPTWMYNYFTNKKLQRYFGQEIKRQTKNSTVLGEEGTVNTPTSDFNRIYILLHIYKHLFQEGIGLRQLLDYYYVLAQGFTTEEQAETTALFKKFNILRFAGATMYVLKRVFNIDDKYIIVPPIEKEGKALLHEIMEKGNFGKYSPDIALLQSSSPVIRAYSHTKENLKLLFSYPDEILWAPLFRMWHYFWMRMKK